MMVVNPDTAARLTESVEFLLEEGARYLILSMNHAGFGQRRPNLPAGNAPCVCATTTPAAA